jgi:hypothetical protein
MIRLVEKVYQQLPTLPVVVIRIRRTTVFPNNQQAAFSTI